MNSEFRGQLLAKTAKELESAGVQMQDMDVEIDIVTGVVTRECFKFIDKLISGDTVVRLAKTVPKGIFTLEEVSNMTHVAMVMLNPLTLTLEELMGCACFIPLMEKKAAQHGL